MAKITGATGSYNLANDSSLRTVVDLEAGTFQKLNSSGTTLSTDTVISADVVWGTQGNDRFVGCNF